MERLQSNEFHAPNWLKELEPGLIASGITSYAACLTHERIIAGSKNPNSVAGVREIASNIASLTVEAGCNENCNLMVKRFPTPELPLRN